MRGVFFSFLHSFSPTGGPSSRDIDHSRHNGSGVPRDGPRDGLPLYHALVCQVGFDGRLRDLSHHLEMRQAIKGKTSVFCADALREAAIMVTVMTP